jgi:hypothetical protein
VPYRSPKPPQPKGLTAKEAKALALELAGVIIDVEKGDGFDDVCLKTIKRVHDALRSKA